MITYTEAEFEALVHFKKLNPPPPPTPSDAHAYALWLESPLPSSLPFIRAVLAQQFGTVCPICRGEIDVERGPRRADSPEIDHLVPSSRGGRDVWGNVRLAHRHCNQRRNDLRDGELDVEDARTSLARAVFEDANPVVFLPRKIAERRGILNAWEGHVLTYSAALNDAIASGAPEAELAIAKRNAQKAVRGRDSWKRSVDRLVAEYERALSEQQREPGV